ncbi:hypothetical protein WN51_13043 [Melipona quadrifasciata]|uniref:Uncharacterized protein n=1 Tax=Melipona quadrifasciata TaxID=166423 RepID=A0A0M9ACW1_9HYME|nr:hypothetical protein WN51_13043 [Melipona quadrifasciata]
MFLLNERKITGRGKSSYIQSSAEHLLLEGIFEQYDPFVDADMILISSNGELREREQKYICSLVTLVKVTPAHKTASGAMHRVIDRGRICTLVFLDAGLTESRCKIQVEFDNTNSSKRIANEMQIKVYSKYSPINHSFPSRLELRSGKEGKMFVAMVLHKHNKHNNGNNSNHHSSNNNSTRTTNNINNNHINNNVTNLNQTFNSRANGAKYNKQHRREFEFLFCRVKMFHPTDNYRRIAEYLEYLGGSTYTKFYNLPFVLPIQIFYFSPIQKEKKLKGKNKKDALRLEISDGNFIF